jgi:hypothetical protein
LPASLLKKRPGNWARPGATIQQAGIERKSSVLTAYLKAVETRTGEGDDRVSPTEWVLNGELSHDPIRGHDFQEIESFDDRRDQGGGRAIRLMAPGNPGVRRGAGDDSLEIEGLRAVRNVATD